MPTYRMQPVKTGKYFALICTIVALAVIIPTAILAILGSHPKPTRPLVFTSAISDWEVPVDGVNCAFDPMGTGMSSYSCSHVDVGADWVHDVNDSDFSLRRAVRAQFDMPYTYDPIVHSGRGSVMVMPYDNIVAMSIKAVDPYQGEECHIVLQGNPAKLVPLTQKIWEAFSPGSFPVDLVATFDIAQQEKSSPMLDATAQLPQPRAIDSHIKVKA